MLLGDIIKQYRIEHQMSLQNFADLIGTSKSYIYMLEKNENPTTRKPINPSIETLKSVASAMNMDLDTLLKQLDTDQKIYADENEYQKQFPAVKSFPIYNIPDNTLLNGELLDENIVGYEIAPSLFYKKGCKYFYLLVNEDSMNFKFSKGDIILVQKQNSLKNDETGAMVIDNKLTIKKYKKENGIVILSSLSFNQQNTIQTYKSSKVKILRKVVGCLEKID